MSWGAGSRISIGALALGTLISCDAFRGMNSETLLARKQADKYVALIRPTSAGYSVAPTSGEVAQNVSGTDGPVFSYTPDFSGFSFVRWQELEDGRSQFSLTVELENLDPIDVVSKTTDLGETDSRFEPRLQWTANNGSSFLVELDGVLTRFSVCGTTVAREVLARQVRSFGFDQSTLYFLDAKSRGRFVWSPLTGEKVEWESSLDLPGDVDTIYVGWSKGTLIASSPSEWSGVIEKFYLIDIAARQVQPLDVPSEGRVFNFIPLKDSNSAVVELWLDGAERLDGTELTQFFLWDYASNNVTWLSKNKKMWTLHSLPDNMRELPPACQGSTVSATS